MAVEMISGFLWSKTNDSISDGVTIYCCHFASWHCWLCTDFTWAFDVQVWYAIVTLRTTMATNWKRKKKPTNFDRLLGCESRQAEPLRWVFLHLTTCFATFSPDLLMTLLVLIENLKKRQKRSSDKFLHKFWLQDGLWVEFIGRGELMQEEVLVEITHLLLIFLCEVVIFCPPCTVRHLILLFDTAFGKAPVFACWHAVFPIKVTPARSNCSFWWPCFQALSSSLYGKQTLQYLCLEWYYVLWVPRVCSGVSCPDVITKRKLNMFVFFVIRVC